MKCVCILLLILTANFGPSGHRSSIAIAGATSALAAYVVDSYNAQAQVRIALIGLGVADSKGGSRAIELALAEGLSRDSRVALIDQSLLQSALAGIGSDGSINLSKAEARRLGAAIGCDFLIVGKTEVLTRSARENESHEEAYAGVMIVDGRTGALAAFDFISEKAATREAAVNGLKKVLTTRAAGYIDRIAQLREARFSTGVEPAEEMPEEGSPRAAGFSPPEFLNRVKPEYTGEAEQADITATVEAMVVFRFNGEVGRVEVTRWAGFGLDESAERAIRQLKFKPATRDGKTITVRALIRYNFRRVSEDAKPLEQPAGKPPDKPERDLRQLFKPTYRRP